MNGLRRFCVLLTLFLSLVLALVASLALPPAAQAFTDIDPADPYAAAIVDLAARGIVSGRLDGTFAPDEAVSRCQFAKMIVNTLGLPHTDVTMPFTDLGPDDHPGFVAALAATGITNGTDTAATLFSPWSDISRAQLITMVVRGLDATHPGLLTPRVEFSPWGYFDSAHGESAAAACANRLLDGIPVARLDPWAPINRGEAAQVLANAVREIEWDPWPAVRALSTSDIRHIEVRTEGPDWQGAPLRVLVPSLDAPAIAELLDTVATVSPSADEGSPYWSPSSLPAFTVRTLDDRELRIALSDDDRAVSVTYQEAGRSRTFWGGSQAVSDLAQDYQTRIAADETRGNPGAELPTDMPSDFGMVAAYGVMGRNILDSFEGVFTKDLIAWTYPSTAGTGLRLTDTELREIYGLLREMGATCYPVRYVPPETGVFGAPYSSYYLRFRADGQITEIRWADYNFSQEERAVDLLHVMERIQQIILATDEYKALPPFRGGYA